MKTLSFFLLFFCLQASTLNAQQLSLSAHFLNKYRPAYVLVHNCMGQPIYEEAIAEKRKYRSSLKISFDAQNQNCLALSVFTIYKNNLSIYSIYDIGTDYELDQQLYTYPVGTLPKVKIANFKRSPVVRVHNWAAVDPTIEFEINPYSVSDISKGKYFYGKDFLFVRTPAFRHQWPHIFLWINTPEKHYYYLDTDSDALIENYTCSTKAELEQMEYYLDLDITDFKTVDDYDEYKIDEDDRMDLSIKTDFSSGYIRLPVSKHSNSVIIPKDLNIESYRYTFSETSKAVSHKRENIKGEIYSIEYHPLFFNHSQISKRFLADAKKPDFHFDIDMSDYKNIKVTADSVFNYLTFKHNLSPYIGWNSYHDIAGELAFQYPDIPQAVLDMNTNFEAVEQADLSKANLIAIKSDTALKSMASFIDFSFAHLSFFEKAYTVIEKMYFPE